MELPQEGYKIDVNDLPAFLSHVEQEVKVIELNKKKVEQILQHPYCSPSVLLKFIPQE